MRHRSGILFDMRLHRTERLISHVMNEEPPDNWLGDRRQRSDPKAQRVLDLDEHSGRRLFKSPDDPHPASERFQVQKAQLHPLPIDHKLRRPGDRNPRAARRHLDNAVIGMLLEKMDVAIVRQYTRPLREIGGGLEDDFARRVHDDRVAGLHGLRKKERQDKRRTSPRNNGREYGLGNS
jgi:hypothetical protein